LINWNGVSDVALGCESSTCDFTSHNQGPNPMRPPRFIPFVPLFPLLFPEPSGYDFTICSVNDGLGRNCL
jgi:hypothetical protein